MTSCPYSQIKVKGIKNKVCQHNHITNRLLKLHASLENNKLDGFLVSHQSNIAYLTGLPSSDSYLLITPKKNVFITDSRYYQHVQTFLKHRQKQTFQNQRSSKTEVLSVKLRGKSLFQTISGLACSAKIKRLGFESRSLDFAQYQEIKKRLEGIRLIPTTNLVEELRKLKDKEEVGNIKKAVRIAVLALKYAQTIIRPGISELQIAAELERFIRYQGARTTSFETIVASGPNSAFAHHLTSTKKILEGENVVIDMGVDYLGYKSDLTRTFFLGKIPSKIRMVHDIVLKAQTLAIERIKPGIRLSVIDKSARQHIAEHGFGGLFGHNLGHGIGLDIHEEPFISPLNDQKAEEGMVFTVEPAVYVPDKFGIRIEDDVLVTNNGCEILSYDLNK